MTVSYRAAPVGLVVAPLALQALHHGPSSRTVRAVGSSARLDREFEAGESSADVKVQGLGDTSCYSAPYHLMVVELEFVPLLPTNFLRGMDDLGGDVFRR